MSKFSDDFMRGQADCKNGLAGLQGQTEDYYRGYSAEYEMEQLISNRSMRQEDENNRKKD